MTDWDNLRIFLAIARAGQILSAAKSLHLNHATVARRLDALEKSLGTRLFDRRTTGAMLTP
ncbi:MAG: LysR family transcriptional regulator, partial [Rhizobiales bacterium]|nr:LysR family transcriptional regulator [Hyphomicrobiales bacterium]